MKEDDELYFLSYDIEVIDKGDVKEYVLVSRLFVLYDGKERVL